MLFDRTIENWLHDKAHRLDIPASVRLWDGREFSLSRTRPAEVVLSLRNRAAISTLVSPSIDGLAEAYVNGDIDISGALPHVIDIAYKLSESSGHKGRLGMGWRGKLAHTRQRDKKAIEHHYDVSDEFYRLWLGQTMVYSCAYFEHGNEDINLAQAKKIEHVFRKISLQPGHRLLDIGCGWGELVIRAARDHGASCVGVTLSQHQFETARRRVVDEGLSERIEIRLQDYRDVEGTFDRITSIGMFEHVGRKNLPAYFAKMSSLLTEDGVAMNHGITSTDPDIGQSPTVDGGGFMDKYVFPDGELPHLGQVLIAMQKGGLEALDIENLRRHYARTLNVWNQTFERRASRIRTVVDEQKYRIWRVYLAGCAHAFEHDLLSLNQVICRKSGRLATTLPWNRRYIYDLPLACASEQIATTVRHRYGAAAVLETREVSTK